MAEYRVEVEPSVLRAMRRLSLADQQRIAQRIRQLASDPRPAATVKLTGMVDAYRLRQGNYRVVYTIDDQQAIVTITRVAHRREAYR